jgi:hypothetical protein
MKRTMLRGNLVFCLTLLLVSASYTQGVYWETTTTGTRESDEARVTKSYYMPKKLKVVDVNDGNVVILRLDKELMVVINTKEKTYHEMTFAEMEAAVKGASAQMDAAMKEMEKQMAGLSKEQQETMKKMMGSRMPNESAKVEVSKTGEHKTISGYDCTKYVLTRGGEELSVVWVTLDVKEFDAMRKDMEEFGRRMEAIVPKGSKGLKEAMYGIQGFPIQTESADGEKTVVVKIENRSTPASEFEVQEGFEKEESPLNRGAYQE